MDIIHQSAIGMGPVTGMGVTLGTEQCDFYQLLKVALKGHFSREMYCVLFFFLLFFLPFSIHLGCDLLPNKEKKGRKKKTELYK